MCFLVRETQFIKNNFTTHYWVEIILNKASGDKRGGMNKIIPTINKFEEASVNQTVGSFWSSGSDSQEGTFMNSWHRPGLDSEPPFSYHSL